MGRVFGEREVMGGLGAVVVPASQIRAQLVQPGDLRNEIGFQNDINILLAALEDGHGVWRLEAPLMTPRGGDTRASRDRYLQDSRPTLELVATRPDLWAVEDTALAPRAA